MKSILINTAVTLLLLVAAYSIGQLQLESYVDERVQNYIVSNPALVAQAAGQGIQLLREAEQVARQKFIKSIQLELEGNSSDPAMGNPEADVKIVLFSDYNCGYCRKVHPVLESLLASDDKLQVIVKEYPVLGPVSELAALTALAVNHLYPEKYNDFQRIVFQTNLSSEDDILAVTSSLDMNTEQIVAEIERPEHKTKLQENLALGNRLQVNGTPAFVIDGDLYPGALSAEQLRVIIDKVRAART